MTDQLAAWNCPIELLRPWKGQPRSEYDPVQLDELADSIRKQGVIEPLVVRSVGKDQWEIICGERRWRAAQRAGLLKVPIIERNVDDDTAFEIAVTENVSRASLSFADFAVACERYRARGMTGVEIAKRFGCSEKHISDALAVFRNVAPQVLALNREGKLANTHLVALRNVADKRRCLALAQRAISEGMTVAQLAAEVMRGPTAAQRPRKSAGIRDMELRFERKLGMHCQITSRGKDKVKLVLSGSLDQLDVLVELAGI